MQLLSLILALGSLTPFTSSAPENYKDLKDPKNQIEEQAETATSRIQKHISEVRGEISQNADVLMCYDDFVRSLKEAYSNQKMNEGDLHYIVEAVAFSSDYPNQSYHTILEANDLLRHGIYKKDILISTLIEDTVKRGASFEEIKKCFGKNVAENVEMFSKTNS